MAKMNVTVDNSLDDVNLISNEVMKKKKTKNKENKNEKKKIKNKQKKNNGYLKQVAQEMKNVTWPTRKNMIKYSIATIIMIIILSLFFVGISALFDLLYALVQGWFR